MGDPETRIAIQTDEERRVVTLVGWRRRLYQVALPVGVAGVTLQVLDLVGDHLGVWARVGRIAVFLAVGIPFALLGASTTSWAGREQTRITRNGRLRSLEGT